MDDGVYRFGDVQFDEARRELSVSGRAVELDRPCAAILGMLLREAEKDVSKDRLLAAGWPGRIVHENSLAKAITRLRQILGADGTALATVHGYGYRLAASVERHARRAADPEQPTRAPMFLRPAPVFAATLLAGLGAWALVTPWQVDGRKQIVNGEPGNSVGRVLWVDDHPENNVEERRYLEKHRIAIYQVSTTEEALTLLGMYAYGGVVSDMGRGNRPLAGIELLKAMRARGDQRPFFLYTVYSSAAQHKLVADSGGQGVAESPNELYTALLPLFGEAE